MNTQFIDWDLIQNKFPTTYSLLLRFSLLGELEYLRKQKRLNKFQKERLQELEEWNKQ
jgi:hypothetical protein